jgi:hypothetical protein
MCIDGRGQMFIDHGAIPGLMEAMGMTFEPEDPHGVSPDLLHGCERFHLQHVQELPCGASRPFPLRWPYPRYRAIQVDMVLP